jgi:hypothetical protein
VSVSAIRLPGEDEPLGPLARVVVALVAGTIGALLLGLVYTGWNLRTWGL